ncbi:MAG TPA: lipid-A-disaccharide synthase [Planctomycetota bacterium]
MVAIEVTLTLVREVLRALGTPLRLLGYLPFRHHWRRVAREVLDAAAHSAPEAAETSLREFFAKRRAPQAARPHLFVSAGEASGEAHAARLVRALDHSVRCTAFGGHQLEQAGAVLRYALSEHAVMGITGVLRQLPLLLRAFASYLRMLRDDPPDLVVLVDYPGLHVVMAKAARRRKIPVLHYVAPQYWAWGPWRMRRYRRAVDATLTILPFETAFFRRFRIPAAYIGHPLLDDLAEHPPDATSVASVRKQRTLVLLPGSRRAEIEANLPGMLRIARELRAVDPACRVVLPHKDRRRTGLLRTMLAQHDAAFVEHHEGPLAPWLAGAWLILAKSGTGSLEACLHGNPTIVVYRLRGLVSTLGYHNILSVPWIAAANLIAGRAVVPEFCFHHAGGWDDVLAAARTMWAEGPDRSAVLEGLADVRQRLGAAGATARVASIVRTFLVPEARA